MAGMCNVTNVAPYNPLSQSSGPARFYLLLPSHLKIENSRNVHSRLEISAATTNEICDIFSDLQMGSQLGKKNRSVSYPTCGIFRDQLDHTYHGRRVFSPVRHGTHFMARKRRFIAISLRGGPALLIKIEVVFVRSN